MLSSYGSVAWILADRAYAPPPAAEKRTP